MNEPVIDYRPSPTGLAFSNSTAFDTQPRFFEKVAGRYEIGFCHAPSDISRGLPLTR